MGCAQSRIENEEAVSRCKDRKKFMKEAVLARNAVAAAHSAYVVALKSTGAALSDYGEGEVHDHPISLPDPTAEPHLETLFPPPPLPNFSPSPLKRSATMPVLYASKPSDHKPADTIREEVADGNSSENDVMRTVDEPENDDNLNQRRNRNKADGGRTPEAAEPPPPASPGNNPLPPPPPQTNGVMDYFFRMDENIHRSSLSEVDEIRAEKEEGNGDGEDFDGGFKRVDADGIVNSDVDGIDGTVEVEPQTPENPVKSTIVHSHTAPVDLRRVGKAATSVNLLQILNALDNHFLKASESAHEVSQMLEATRLHYHSNFADNRGHIDHSARVLHVITWNRSFKGLSNANDWKDDFDSEEYDTHATVLDKLLAWEKKLYDEVKAGELLKLEYQRKVSSLNKHKKRGANTETMEKIKAAVSHLHTRYIVDMQSMDSTVSEISHIRDNQLYPKLVALADGLAKMWEAMNENHNSQHKIAVDLRAVDISQAPEETSKHHYERTCQLWKVAQEWHSQFQKLMTHQKEYIQVLKNWLKLNLIPVESTLREKVSSPPKVHQPPIQSLLHAWHDHLEKLPDDLARSAISAFAAVIKTIIMHQEDEMKLKEKCEEARKEYERKNRAFEDWYRKYLQRRSSPDELDPERTDDTSHRDPVVERQYAVEALKKRLEDEVEAHQKLARQVREKSLASLKMHLPELFRTMSDFAHASSDMYSKLRSDAELQNAYQNPS